MPAPLDDDLRALLDAERRATAPQRSLDRAWNRLQAAQTGAVASSNEGRPEAAASSGGASAPPVARLVLAGWKVPLALAVAFGMGMASGVSIRARRATMPSVMPVVAARVTPPPPPLAPPEPPAPVAVLPTIPTMPPRSLPAAPTAGGSSLKAERTLLDGVRASLSEGDSARALRLADAHRRRFPHAQLAEEREALAIQALVLSGQSSEARERADRFRSEFPNSLFLPTVQTSVASIP